MKTHRLKCWPEFFQPALDGIKNFDVRLNDRKFEVGDKVILEEYDPRGCGAITGRKMDFIIPYLLKDVPWVMPGHVIISIPGRI